MTTPFLVPQHSASDCWADSDRAVLECRAVHEITHDVRTFSFADPSGGTFHFQAGQFVTIEADVDGQTLHRCYTVSSPPTRPHLLSITVKRVVGGPVSNWLHDTMRPGHTIPVQAPLGSFTLQAPVLSKYLFMSAGSGITPMMSMTRTLNDLGIGADVLFLHSARTPADIIYRKELEAIASISPNVQVVHVCEGDYPSERWLGLRGRLSATMLLAVAPDVHERESFVCGPTAYMSSVRRILEDVGYDLGRHHEESFSFDALPPQDAQAVEEASGGLLESPQQALTGTTYRVEFVKSGVSVECPPDKTLLEAAYQGGLKPPVSCVQGMCGTCKQTKLAGEVDMQHNGGIRPREIAQGKILICCSRPLSDVQLDA